MTLQLLCYSSLLQCNARSLCSDSVRIERYGAAVAVCHYGDRMVAFRLCLLSDRWTSPVTRTGLAGFHFTFALFVRCIRNLTSREIICHVFLSVSSMKPI